MSENEKKGILDKWKEKNAEKKKKKLIEMIKKKDEQINKDKEEIKKMALELKDGKLVTKTETNRGAPAQPAAPQQYAAQMQPIAQRPQQYAARPAMQPQPMAHPQQHMQQPIETEEASSLEDNSPFDIPEQQFENQPIGPQEFSQEDAMKDVPINFVMVGGMTFQFVTKLGGLTTVLKYVAESINNQEVIELGNRLINPRHIVFYEY